MVLTSGGNLKCKKILHLIGPTSSEDMVPALERILEECVNHSIKTVALPAIGTGMAFMNPSDSITRIIEGLIQHFEKNTHTSLTKICIIAFTNKVYQAYSQAFKTISFQIQESEPYSGDNFDAYLRNPPTWTDMDTDEYKTIELSNKSIEYRDIEKKFYESAKPYTCKLIKIERVQNVKLWQSYRIRKLFADRLSPYQENEKLLFHGTNIETAQKIIKYGFNRTYCGKNATLYGCGTYFALNAWYSCTDTYSVPDKDGHKHIIVADVITGKWRKGESRYKDAPPTGEDPETRCDSVVDDVDNPTMFVIFCDDGAYPKYSITIKR
ncbi:protein mono-ADP-ribosyltransferase PARP15-like [Xenopus tropicalis]|nr:protein mono-ADP-ribosyltransferase PARP15-like [Xenopus tropicalis]